MSESAIYLVGIIAMCFGFGFFGAIVGDGLLSALRWYGRRRGWLPKRTFYFRIPIYEGREDQDGQ
jgi:hypothetical protein